MPRARRFAVAILAAAALIGCGDYSEVEIDKQSPTAPCQDVADTLASLAFACGANHARANARYHHFFDNYQCVAYDPTTTPFEELWHCSYSISQLDCATVDEYGTDFDRYFTLSPACPLIIRRADGSGLPGGFALEAAQ